MSPFLVGWNGNLFGDLKIVFRCGVFDEYIPLWVWLSCFCWYELCHGSYGVTNGPSELFGQMKFDS